MSAPTPARIAQLLAALEVEMDTARMLRLESAERHDKAEADTHPTPPQLVLVPKK
jgi:hypothetical protein